ncbi:MAG: ATP-binding cassette domain-containing protein, partial [Clostridia bacterium]|nr:ATP-binding cassette domain-containing protein [Clostridia bacterium]
MLRLENISFVVDSDDGRREILRDVSVEFPDGFTVITGPNGGGKSTLAKIISGIYTPTAGKIWLDDRDITGLSITERANAGISYAFQQPV